MNATVKYSDCVILHLQENKNGNSQYYLDKKFLGSGNKGMDVFIKRLTGIPDYSIIIVYGLNESQQFKGIFYKDKKYSVILNDIKEKKHLLFAFFKKNCFNYSRDNIDFIYVNNEWQWFLNSKEINVKGLDSNAIVKKLNLNFREFIIVVFDGNIDQTVSVSSFRDLPEITRFEDSLKKNKCNFIILFTCCDTPIYYDYETDMKKTRKRIERKKQKEEIDKALAVLPSAFKEIKIDGRFYSISAFILKLNSILKSNNLSYAISEKTPVKIKNFIDFCEMDLYNAIKYVSYKYRLKVIIEKNEIILQKTPESEKNDSQK